MPFITSKLRGMLHSDSHSRKTQRTPGVERQLQKQGSLEDQHQSSESSSSASISEAKKSDHVLEVLKSTFQLKNLKTVKDVTLKQLDGDPIDDKTYLMERIVQLAADLPATSRTSATLTNSFLNQLWTDLQHPPQSYLGADYIYRQADGSNNNILWPHLGAAKQPYARTVRPRLLQPVSRPDPGLIFDSLLARKGFKPHPNRISSVLFYVASIIIHDIFHTSHKDFAISDTSSYLDLAPLYGSSFESQHGVRTMSDGKLKPDCFADERILGFPPGVGVLLIMFNRFHNHVAENLARIDEGGRFSRILSPPGRAKPADGAKLYDEALFQTARLVTCGLYVNIIMKDYVRTILNLNRVDTQWNLDPRSEDGSGIFGHKIPEATGNSVSAEFNLVYRWHSCISQRDEEWTKDQYEKLVGKDPTISMNQFLRALNEWAMKLSPDPLQRDFAGLERLPDGKLRDEDLASIWTASVSDVAGSYGAHHVPEILRNVEILGITQSRSWNLASLNEFRAYFKLEPHKKFEDINPDPIVAEQLRCLYGHPDNVEIYPGIIVESAKEPKLPGSGLCTNFTTSRAILSDAVALVRGDRFYTVDYMPCNLTNWGFQEANYDLDINYGCVLYKLVLNALPDSYAQNSIFAHYPLTVPDENKAILGKLGKSHLYNFDTPTGLLLANGEAKVAASPLAEDAPGLHLATSMVGNEGLFKDATAFYKKTIPDLLRRKSYELANRRFVDIVGEVFNIAHARFVASVFFPRDDDPSKLIAILTSVHGSTNVQQPSRRFLLANRRIQAQRLFREQVQDDVSRSGKTHLGLHSSTDPLRKHAVQAIHTILQKGSTPEQVTSEQIVPLAAQMFVHQSRVFAEALDQLLGPENGSSPLEEFHKDRSNGSILSGIIGSHTDQGTLEGKLAASTAEIALGILCDLDKLQRAAGATGRLRRLENGASTTYLNIEESKMVTYPRSMLISWAAS